MRAIILFIMLMAIPFAAFAQGEPSFLEKNAVYIGLAVLILEYILGKTSLVKPNSVLGMILDPLVDYLKKQLSK